MIPVQSTVILLATGTYNPIALSGLQNLKLNKKMCPAQDLCLNSIHSFYCLFSDGVGESFLCTCYGGLAAFQRQSFLKIHFPTKVVLTRTNQLSFKTSSSSRLVASKHLKCFKTLEIFFTILVKTGLFNILPETRLILDYIRYDDVL